MQRRLLALMMIALGAGCDIHDGYFEGEFNAGGANPYNFPPPYRGSNPVPRVCTGSTACLARERAGNSSFNETAAFANKKAIGYFSFPFSPTQVATTNYAAPVATSWPDRQIDPLRVSGAGTDFRKNAGNPVPVPLVYDFDPGSGPKCRVPSGYKYDAYRDAFPLTEQWNVFTFLPDRFTTYPFGELPNWSYRPVVAEVPVTTRKHDCQAVKSERTLLSLADSGDLSVPRGGLEADGETRLGAPTPDRFLAWALIDPGSPVLRVGQRVNINSGGTVNGTSVQKYGWYGQFIVAYIDGGTIPVDPGPEVAGKPTQRMRPQRLYYPRSNVVSRPGASPAPGQLGAGYDVLQADRFEDPAHYSPVCEVWTYSLPGSTLVSDLPKDEATILAKASSTLEPARTTQSPTAYTPSPTIVPPYFFCLQAAPLPP
jgi:hypothetical protein